VVLGGVPVSEEDVGYGPVRYLRPSQVIETYKAIQFFSSEQLWLRFNTDALKSAKIYPGFEGGEEDKEYICGNFEKVKYFFEAAASKKEAMLLYFN
jgi:hypothetical protein